MNTAAATDLETEVQVGRDGFARLAFRGRLNAEITLACWNKLEQKLRGATTSTLEVRCEWSDAQASWFWRRWWDSNKNKWVLQNPLLSHYPSITNQLLTD